jgi:cytochrome P450
MPLVRPPGPPPVTYHPLSLLLHLRRMGRDPSEEIARRFDRYGDLYRLPFLGREVYVTRHPEHIQQILVTEADKFGKPREGVVARQLGRLLGDGLLLSDGELWRKQRRLIQPAFRKERIDQYARIVATLAEDFASQLRDGQQLDVGRSMIGLTLRIVSKALFDHDVAGDSDRVARATETFRKAFGGLSALLPANVPTPRNRAINRAIGELDALIYGLADLRAGEAAPRAPSARGQTAGANGPPHGGVDLLTALAGAVDEQGDGTGMSRKQLRDELMTLLLAGHETTSHALSWTFHLLAQHPELEARVRHEAMTVLGNRKPAPRDVDKLHFTEQVLSEAMRLYPPAYALARVAIQDAEVGGYTVPAGTDMLIWIYHAQRDPRWFREPGRFDPDRFSPARRGTIPPFAYLPFGLGTRTCIGKHFALMEAKLVLACTLRRVSLTDLGAQLPARDMAVTLAPRDGLPMRVHVL